jgi:prohibitin 2
MQAVAFKFLTRAGRPRLSIKAFYQRHATTINLGAILGGLAIFALWHWITVVVPAGHAGVKWYRFMGGTDTQSVYTEGTHFMWPWDGVAIYDMRLQIVTRDFDILTKDGLMMKATISCQFRLNPGSLGEVHKSFGSNYLETMLTPALGSYSREVLSQNSTDEIYTTRRLQVQDEIRDAVEHDLVGGLFGRDDKGAPWIQVKDVLISGMQFPQQVQTAINRKMEQYQVRQEYAYRLEREELESRRKEVEGRGIAQFQAIVGAGISENYLRWKGIDATLALARSPNSKVVVIGANRDGLPVMLGGVDSQLAPAAQAAKAPAAPEANRDAAPQPAPLENTTDRQSNVPEP